MWCSTLIGYFYQSMNYLSHNWTKLKPINIVNLKLDNYNINFSSNDNIIELVEIKKII